MLYVVAGDRHWISTCFETQYDVYKEVAREPAQKLGYLFLEKAFQLSLRLPNISPEAKEKYWTYILDPTRNRAPDEVTLKTKQEEERKQNAIKAEITRTYSQSDLLNPDIVKEIVAKSDFDEKIIKDAVLEVMDGNTEDLRHLLSNNHELIDTNPRSIKRLANQYTIYRNILMVESKKFDRDKLFRWLVLQNKYPMFTDWVERNGVEFQLADMQNVEVLKTLSADSKWHQLMLDETGKNGGMINADDISVFTGISMKRNNKKEELTALAVNS